MPKVININALGQSIDSTWGRSSTPRSASYSVKFTLQGGDRVIASYSVITNFVSEKQMIEMKRNAKEESNQIISKSVQQVKETYKQLTGENVSFSEESSTDSIEIIGFNVHNPKRTAYFRRNVVFSLS